MSVTSQSRPKARFYHGEAYLRPLVKVHPETGKKNLFIGRHAFGIPGLTRTESRSLLKELMDFVVSEPKRVYQHKWQEGDLLFWDNRALLHRACAYDYRQARVMIATRVAGDKESELAYYPEDPAAEAGRFALAQELEILRHEKGALRDSAVAQKDSARKLIVLNRISKGDWLAPRLPQWPFH